MLIKVLWNLSKNRVIARIVLFKDLLIKDLLTMHSNGGNILLTAVLLSAIFEKLEFLRIESLGMHLKLTLWITYLKISN